LRSRRQDTLLSPTPDHYFVAVLREYGHRHGWLRHHAWTALLKLGWRRHLQSVDWQRVERCLFACQGNICRSPYAEHRARCLGIDAISFGIETTPGRRAASTAVRVAARRGVDLTNHRSRSAEDLTIAASDLVIAMEPRQLSALLSLARASGGQLTLLGLWCLPIRPVLEDPYGLSETHFQICFSVIDDALFKIRGRISGTVSDELVVRAATV